MIDEPSRDPIRRRASLSGQTEDVTGQFHGHVRRLGQAKEGPGVRKILSPREIGHRTVIHQDRNLLVSVRDLAEQTERAEWQHDLGDQPTTRRSLAAPRRLPGSRASPDL